MAGPPLERSRPLTRTVWRFPRRVKVNRSGHFKCNRRRLVDYPSLWGFTRERYQHPGVADTVDLDQIRTHYYRSHTSINPTRVVPVGPAPELERPHGRDHLVAEDHVS